MARHSEAKDSAISFCSRPAKGNQKTNSRKAKKILICGVFCASISRWSTTLASPPSCLHNPCRPPYPPRRIHHQCKLPISRSDLTPQCDLSKNSTPSTSSLHHTGYLPGPGTPVVRSCSLLALI
ncbi:hypothetical protein SODALDRAFT_24639 [Sodiomyces alkalinus F11]|uniref:Uncharacterized protein n=1 Tax=Sodiomyces alkalinus (strain CBS 110278 / VKM F-3762 / F11) TaxID=1314773 RepID=A0A3N2Q7V3_SODAK|nr:hypothetical protein SODALDRAFT_24639 [Sodiomyces alkalinus F11]ROT42822.1 hypothetical protein SODALDRAFT_24639 [Sodiomyces alkalinus F11]